MDTTPIPTPDPWQPSAPPPWVSATSAPAPPPSPSFWRPRTAALIAGAAVCAVLGASVGGLATAAVVGRLSPTVSAPQSLPQGANSGSGANGTIPNGSGNSSAGGGWQPDGSGTAPGGAGNPQNNANGGSDVQTGSTAYGTAVTGGRAGVVLIDTKISGGTGAGTGMVLTSDGTILTNYHVVEGSTTVTVTDSVSGQQWAGTVVGHDATHDIAVVRVEATGLTAITPASGATPVGTAVTAIGQGGGQGVLYAASGQVTATGQSITAQGEGSAERLTGLLETDANIVPGYSGGPLFNAAGEVVGIDTAASSGGAIDGYAVPIAQAVTIAEQIMAGHRSATVHIGAKATLGVYISSGASQGRASRVPGRGGASSGGGVASGNGGVVASAGAAVVDVVAGGGAAGAGVTAGSLITGLDGKTVNSGAALTQLLDRCYPGGSATIAWTDASGTPHTATITLGTSTTN